MKTLALFISLLFLSSSKISKKETRYGFFKSRAFDMQAIEGKSDLKYTKVFKIEAEKGELLVYAKQWSNFIQPDCKYGKCTGDFSHYDTKEAAEEQFKAMLNNPEHVARFNFIEVDFKVDTLIEKK
jgi:hypothetical protein